MSRALLEDSVCRPPSIQQFLSSGSNSSGRLWVIFCTDCESTAPLLVVGILEIVHGPTLSDSQPAFASSPLRLVTNLQKAPEASGDSRSDETN